MVIDPVVLEDNAIPVFIREIVFIPVVSKSPNARQDMVFESRNKILRYEPLAYLNSIERNLL